MTLDFLIPQYKEDESIIKPLLDSIANQIDVNFDDIQVIIVNDGSDVLLSEEFLSQYPFKILYGQGKHEGVSATRNTALSLSKADYVMFCDADDSFVSLLGLYNIIQNLELHFIQGTPIDILTSRFVEQTKPKDSDQLVYIDHEHDKTFIHGKVYRREFLEKNNLKFNPNLLVNEDSYFVNLCETFAEKTAYMDLVIYIWKWRKESVCRQDPNYLQKHYIDLIYAQEAFIEELINRNYTTNIFSNILSPLISSYFKLNIDDWKTQEFAEYREKALLELAKYYNQYKNIILIIPSNIVEETIEIIRKDLTEDISNIDSSLNAFISWLDELEKLRV